MSGSWSEFLDRHNRQPFTPSFNAYLEAQIEDEMLPREVRVGAWLLRSSWGNQSDSCVSPEGVQQGQIDGARALNLSRQAVHPIFQQYAERGYIRFEGREIVLIDDPRGAFASSSLAVGKGIIKGEEMANDPFRSFDAYLEQFIAPRNASAYQAYQQAAQQVKEFRTQYLPEWKAFKETSERVGQNGQSGSPKGSDETSERTGHHVGQGATSATASIRKKSEDLKVSEERPQVENSAPEQRKGGASGAASSPTPPTAPLKTGEKLSEERWIATLNDPIVAAAEELMGRRMADKDPLRWLFADLAARFDIPQTGVCLFLNELVKRKRDHRYPIHSFGALYKMASDDLATWRKQNWARVESRMTQEERAAWQRRPAATMSRREQLEAEIVTLETWLKENPDPDHPDRSQVCHRLADLIAEQEQVPRLDGAGGGQ